MMKKRTEKSHQITLKMMDMGYPADVAELIGGELNTDYTAAQMLGYLRDGNPRCLEDIVDEMLGILAQRERYVQREIARKRVESMNDLYIRGFSIKWDKPVEDYVREIEPIRNIEEFAFSRRITLFTGENGSGKSTLLEALAVACGLNPEGGTLNYHFHTYDDHSMLSGAIRLKRGTCRPLWYTFLRAESFYNVATAAVVDYDSPTDYHRQSHGESFMEFITEHPTKGLFFLDEPEAALSTQKQLELLLFLYRMAQDGSQYIIATHSPILLGMPDADIVSFDGSELRHISYEETESYRITKLFVNNRETLLRKLLQDDED